MRFLIPRHAGVAPESEAFLAAHWEHFFAQALEQVEHDRERWPKPRTSVMLKHWFDIELCQAVLALGGYGD